MKIFLKKIVLEANKADIIFIKDIPKNMAKLVIICIRERLSIYK